MPRLRVGLVPNRAKNRTLNDPTQDKFEIDVLVCFMLLFRLTLGAVNPSIHHLTNYKGIFYGVNAIILGATDKTIADAGSQVDSR